MAKEKPNKGLSDAELKQKYGAVENKDFGKNLVQVALTEFNKTIPPDLARKKAK